MLHEACDAAALAGAVAPFENDHEPLAVLLDVTLQLDEFELERGEFLLVSLALQFPGVRISASSERLLVDLIGKRGIVDIEDRRCETGGRLLAGSSGFARGGCFFDPAILVSRPGGM
jgi:hypothetical protein